MARPCALYRHFDDDGVLLYVGISTRVETRTAEHLASAPWVRFARRGSIEWHSSVGEAQAVEAFVIRAERPVFNRVHAPGQAERVARYLERRGEVPEVSEERPGNLVSLREALELGLIGGSIDALRKAAKRDSFPRSFSAGPKGAYLYDPEQLALWRKRRAA